MTKSVSVARHHHRTSLQPEVQWHMITNPDEALVFPSTTLLTTLPPHHLVTKANSFNIGLGM